MTATYTQHIIAFHKNNIQARKLAMKDISDKARAEHEATLVEAKPKMLTITKAAWVF